MWDAFIGAQISHISLPQSPLTSGTRDCGEQTLNLVQYQPEDAERRLRNFQRGRIGTAIRTQNGGHFGHVN